MPTSLRPSHVRPPAPFLRPTRRNTVRPFARDTPRTSDARLDVIVHSLDVWGLPGNGEFVFSVTVRNSGTEPARDLRVALEIPHACAIRPDTDRVQLWGQDEWLNEALTPTTGWRFTRPEPLEPGEIAALEAKIRLQHPVPRSPEDAALPAAARIVSSSAGNRPTIPLWFNLR